MADDKTKLDFHDRDRVSGDQEYEAMLPASSASPSPRFGSSENMATTAMRWSARPRRSGNWDKNMPEYQIDEMYGQEVVSSRVADAHDPVAAVEKITGQRVSPKAPHEHWFRVIDERGGSVHEFCLERKRSRGLG
jgi:hypothetical protein